VRAVWSLLAVCGVCLAGDPGKAAKTWPWCCYDGFMESVDALAGPGASDCGYLNFAAAKVSSEQQRKSGRCVRAALEGAQPFKFANSPSEAQSLRVLLRSQEGALWIVKYWRERSHVDIAEHELNKTCKTVSFDDKTLDFEGHDCVDSTEFMLPTYVPHPGR